MDGVVLDDSYASLVVFVDSKCFATLLARHNDPNCDFHIYHFEPIVIGKDLNPSDDIVYMNITLLLFLFNIYRNVECGSYSKLSSEDACALLSAF
jgi:hypothetical protein